MTSALAVDLGGSALKACLFDTKGQPMRPCSRHDVGEDTTLRLRALGHDFFRDKALVNLAIIFGQEPERPAQVVMKGYAP